MWAIVILLVPAALVGIAVAVAISRGRQLRALAERGVPVTGTIVRRLQTGREGGISRTKRITFSYRGPDGREYQRSASVPRGQWHQHEQGASIALVCLPDDPGVSAEARLVDAARDAMTRKGRA
jgi:hypothetical protein